MLLEREQHDAVAAPHVRISFSLHSCKLGIGKGGDSGVGSLSPLAMAAASGGTPSLRNGVHTSYGSAGVPAIIATQPGGASSVAVLATLATATGVLSSVSILCFMPCIGIFREGKLENARLDY